MGVRKLSISLPERILKVLDEYAEREGISRSKAITRILSIFSRNICLLKRKNILLFYGS